MEPLVLWIPDHGWGVIGQIVAALSGIGAVVAAFLAWRTIKSSERTSRAALMLSLDTRLDSFNDVHAKFRPGGEWTWSLGGPRNVDEWVPVKLHMGTFERMYYHYLHGDFDLDYIHRFHGYRLCNLVANDHVRCLKLKEKGEDWVMFLHLLRDLSKHAGKRNICEYCHGDNPGDPWLDVCNEDLING